MEEGSLRCDANVSIRPAGASALGVKVEVKNLNSFRFLQRAIEYEIRRQTEVVRGGGRVDQETRLWDTAAHRTVSMRGKEDAHDYRYFPEPDLPPVEAPAAWVAEVAAGLPELPEARKRRLVRRYGLSADEAGQLADTAGLTAYFEAAAAAAGNAKAAANWIMGEVTRKLNADGGGIGAVGVAPEALGRLIRMVDGGAISGSAAKTVFEGMYGTGREAAEIVESEGLAQIGDEARLIEVVTRVIAANDDAVSRFRDGNEGSLGFLVGQVMRETRGRANPRLVNALLRRALSGDA